MKILVTNNTLKGIGGSETYAYALINELNNREGIEVHGFSKNIGLISEKLRQIGVKITTTPIDEYDLVLASHTSTIRFIKNFNAVKIQTCHGVYPKVEQPIKGVDIYVSISDEVKNHLKMNGYESKIIHNGVDCDRFKPLNSINKDLKRILSLSHSESLNNDIRLICNKLNIEFKTLNKYKNPIFNVEDEINKSDMVITIGRGVYESMACSRNVLILDERHYLDKPPLGDGLVTPHNISDFIKNNCSGRYSGVIFDSKLIEESIRRYDPTLGDDNRDYVVNNLNIKSKVDEYLKLYDDYK